MKPWLRNGIVFGIAAAIATIVVNLLGALNRPADICTTGSGNLALTFTGLALYLLIAGAAGWQTTRTGSRVSRGALAGLITGAVSGIPVLIIVLLSLDAAVRYTHCPQYPKPVPPDDVTRLVGVIVAVLVLVIGIGVGTGAGAVGGAIGEQRDTA